MKIDSKVEQKTVKAEFITINIDPKEKNNLVKVLKDLMKKSKPDRLEEYIINGLIEALENPKLLESPSQSSTPSEFSYTPHQPRSTKHIPMETPEVDKVKIITDLKSKLGTGAAKTMGEFIKESVEYGQKQMGISTAPENESVEAFYDWLVASLIIDVNGNPIGKR